MNMKLLTIISIAFLFLLSCKKSDSHNVGDGTWTVLRTGNFEYNLMVFSTTRHEVDGFKVLTAISTEDTSTPKSINIYFKEWPVSSKRYQPVEFFHSRQLNDDQVGVSLTFPGKDTLYSTGLKYAGFSPEPAAAIKVTSSNGKLVVDIPRMSAYTETNTYIDSAYFQGLVSE